MVSRCSCLLNLVTDPLIFLAVPAEVLHCDRRPLVAIAEIVDDHVSPLFGEGACKLESALISFAKSSDTFDVISLKSPSEPSSVMMMMVLLVGLM